MYTEEKHREYFKIAANNYEDAYDYLVMMAGIFRLWDDNYDQDKVIDPEFADKVFADMNFGLSKNWFYRENQDVLSSFVFLAWNAWKDSNEWKNDDIKIKGLCAWFLRDFCNDIVCLVGHLTGANVRAFSSEYRYFLLSRLVAEGGDNFIKR